MSRPRAARAALGAALACAAALGGPVSDALAHGEGTPTIRSVLDSAPSVPGLHIRVLSTPAPQLRVVNHTAKDLDVLGTDGKPILRVGPGGVYGNVNSIEWFRSGNPDGIGTPRKLLVNGPPRLRRVSSRSSWTFFDLRLNTGRTAISRKVIQAEHDARLDEWSVPMRLGGRSLQVKGHVEYRPVLGATASKVTSGASPLPGVQVNYLPGRVPGFFLVNTGSRPVTVLGGRGEPFARIGPRGVEVNTLSPTHAYDQMARGTRPRTVPDPAAVPRWRRVSAQNSFTWLDGRPIYPHQAPADVVRDHRAAVLKRWSIPLRSDGRRASVRGATTWSPLTTAAATGSGGAGGVGGGLALAIGGFLLFVAAMAGAVRARRRRPRDGRALERAG